MIKEVEAGNVGTLIVKDMSRLGRNYLQVGFYTEILFPQKDVRFLAINNSIDSNNASDNDFAPFLNIMNEFYAKDTSNKIKAVFDARMKDGKRCSGSIPYGYNRLPSDKQTLVVDPVASEVVKRIFLLANEGKSPRAIAEILTEEKVLIPAAYAKEYHPEQYNGIKFADPYIWGISAIRTILSRQEYLGHTVLRKSVSTNFKLHKRKTTDEDEQYVFYTYHIAGTSGQRSEAKETSEQSCGKRYTYQPIKRLSVLCRLWQKIDLADTLQQKRPLLAVFVPLRWLCEQGKFLYCSFNKC